MIIHKCDKCSKMQSQEKATSNRILPDGWFALTYSVGYGTSKRRYDICPDCRVAMGLPEDYKEATQYAGDKLVEIISDIATEQIDNQ